MACLVGTNQKALVGEKWKGNSNRVCSLPDFGLSCVKANKKKQYHDRSGRLPDLLASEHIFASSFLYDRDRCRAKSGYVALFQFPSTAHEPQRVFVRWSTSKQISNHCRPRVLSEISGLMRGLLNPDNPTL